MTPRAHNLMRQRFQYTWVIFNKVLQSVVAMPTSRGSSQPRHWTHISRIPGRFFTKSSGKAKNTGMDSLSILQGIFPTQESNWGLMPCRQILYHLSYQGSQSQRRAMPNNVQTTLQLHSFHMLARLCSKSFKLGFSSMWTEYFQMYKLGFEEAEERIKLSAFIGSWRKQGRSRKTSASLTMLKPLTAWITKKLENSSTDVNTRPP